MTTWTWVVLISLQKNPPSQFTAMAPTWLGKLWPYFHKGDAQNKSHSKAYCKGCVTVKLLLEPADHPKEQHFTNGEIYDNIIVNWFITKPISVACEAAGKREALRMPWLLNVKWKPMTLNALFGGTKPSQLPRIVEADEEDIMQQMMAEAMKDERPDDGAIEIGTDNEWQ